MRGFRSTTVGAAVLFAFGVAPALADGLPARTLTDTDVAVPADLPPGALLIVGFSRGSNAQTEPWRKRADADAELAPLAYSVLVLEGAPRWVRGLIVRGVRRAVPEGQRDSVLIVTKDGDAWRAWVGFEADSQDAAYVLRLDDGGGTCFRYVGAVSEDALLASRDADCGVETRSREVDRKTPTQKSLDGRRSLHHTADGGAKCCILLRPIAYGCQTEALNHPSRGRVPGAIRSSREAPHLPRLVRTAGRCRVPGTPSRPRTAIPPHAHVCG